MNQNRLNNLNKVIRSQHCIRHLEYEVYKDKVNFGNWWLYPPATSKQLNDETDRGKIKQTINEYYTNHDRAINQGQQKVKDTYNRNFTFQHVETSFGLYAWFSGIVANYRISHQKLQIMLKNVSTYNSIYKRHRIEEHLWIYVGRPEAISSIKIGLGDFVILLAKPCHYHHLSWRKRHDPNKHCWFGIVKYGIRVPIFVKSYYPETKNGQIDHIMPYKHGKDYLLGINNTGISNNISIGNDLSQTYQNEINTGKNIISYSHQDTVTKKKIKSLVGTFINRVIRNSIDQGQYMAVHFKKHKSNRIELHISTLDKNISSELNQKIGQRKHRKAPYKINDFYIVPIYSGKNIKSTLKQMNEHKFTPTKNYQKLLKHATKSAYNRIKTLDEYPQIKYDFKPLHFTEATKKNIIKYIGNNA